MSSASACSRLSAVPSPSGRPGHPGGQPRPQTCLGLPAEIRLSAIVIDVRRYRSGNRYRGVGDFAAACTPFF